MPTKTSPQEKLIGKRVKERRTQLELTQQHAAKALGITGQHIQKYESGLDHIPASRLFERARFFSVDVNFFYGEIERYDDFGKEIFITCAGLDNKQFSIKFLDYERVISDVKSWKERADNKPYKRKNEVYFLIQNIVSSRNIRENTL